MARGRFEPFCLELLSSPTYLGSYPGTKKKLLASELHLPCTELRGAHADLCKLSSSAWAGASPEGRSIGTQLFVCVYS